MRYLITYDLDHARSTRYRQIIEHVQADFPVLHKHFEESVFLVATDASTSDVYKRVAAHLQPTDRLFVARIDDWVNHSHSGALTQWLRSHR